MSDASSVDAALFAKLGGDSTLLAYVPDGVYRDVAKHGATRFVIVTQMAHRDEYVQADAGRSALEMFVYLVKAVMKGTSGTAATTNLSAAAARIHTLLQDGTLSPTGYRLLRMQRAERIAYTEDDQASDDRWMHRGGLYEVVVEPS